MKLSDLKDYKKIVIQCHDNPDPDALSSGWALYKYFDENNVDVRFVYSGRFHMTKSNLMLMLSNFNIPIEYEESFSVDDDTLLLTVDCQYDQGNVSTPKAKNVAVIDHHNGRPETHLAEVQSSVGACATIVWKLMKEEGFDFSLDKELSTALYYGLLTDTSGFSDLHHPLDKDMKESLDYDKSLVSLFCNSNISLEEMVIAGDALTNYKLIEKHLCGIVQAKPCDPNILGFIGDLALQVDKFRLCIAFCEVSGGYKLSFRSCDKEVRANEFAAAITKEVGSGGGHVDKAGGFISKEKFDEVSSDGDMNTFLYERVEEYFRDTEVLVVGEDELDISDMKLYEKIPVQLGYVDPTEFLELNEHILVRTLEGDIEITVEDDFYIMIGLLGEVYPIKKAKFNQDYEKLSIPYDMETEYLPTVHSESTGNVYGLFKYAKSCRAIGGATILAKELTTTKKIFNEWFKETYMLGEPGDYIACKPDDLNDIYIIDVKKFNRLYREAH